MNLNETKSQRELLKLVARRKVFSNVFGDVFEFGKENPIGRIESKILDSKSLLEIVGEGKMIEMSSSNPNLVLENRYKIWIKEPYRVIIYGMNPAEQLSFDGDLERVKIYADTKGFTLHEVELINGIVRGNGLRELFDRKVISRPNNRAWDFGWILDKQGFYKAREKLKEENPGCLIHGVTPYSHGYCPHCK